MKLNNLKAVWDQKEICSPACLKARKHTCSCSCMGKNHGSGNENGWFIVSDTFAQRYGQEHLASRLIIKND